MNRRSWVLSLAVMALSAKRLLACHIPVVDDLADLPEGVYGMLRYNPLAAWYAAGGRPDKSGPTYYLPVRGSEVLVTKCVDYHTGEPSSPVYLGCPYPELVEGWLREAASNLGPNQAWVPASRLNEPLA